MKTIPPEEFKAIVDKVMRDYAPLMRRLAAFEAVSHLPVEWVRPPEREGIKSELDSPSLESDQPSFTQPTKS